MKIRGYWETEGVVLKTLAVKVFTLGSFLYVFLHSMVYGSDVHTEET